MSQQPHPPHWADRFLSWYCNPELLEEIQGDAHELYFERLEQKGKRMADLFYYWDVIRFCRLSNVRRPSEFNEAGFFGLLWNINFKLALRNARRNKIVFSIKLATLAICLSFTLLLTALVLNDTTYDHHYTNYKQLYRVGCNVDFQGKQSNIAVSPLPLGPTLAEEVPGIEGYSRFMMMPHAVMTVEEKKFYSITTYAADSNFLKLFEQSFVEGTNAALREANRIVLTESAAYTLFGSQSAIGKIIDLGWTEVEVTGVIRDLPANTHFTFQALVSWDTFDRGDNWTNINAYTYIQVKPGTNLPALDSLISSVAADYLRPMSEDYKFSFHAILQRIDEIHLSGMMDEDFAAKRNRSYLYIILSVIVLFLLTGLFNYLNLALTELTLQLKTISILVAFGGYQANPRKIAFTETVISLLLVIPIVALVISLTVSQPGIFPVIDNSIWTHPLLLAVAAGIIILVLAASVTNGFIAASKAAGAFPSKNGTVQTGLGVRRILVASQLAFSMVMIGLITVILQQFNFVNETDKGFEPSNVIVVRPAASQVGYDALLNSLRGLPGVLQVAGSSYYPDGGVETKDVFDVETTTGQKTLLLNFILGEREYPELLGLRLASGRLFTAKNIAVHQRSFIINETAAKLFGWADPIGRKISFPVNDNDNEGDIIGVVKDFHFESLHARIEPLVIVLMPEGWGVNFIYIKANPLASAAVMESVAQDYRTFFPEAPFEGEYLDARYRNLYQNDADLKNIFNKGLVISVLVSALGIFSISALILTLRNKEMGIRKIVGASRLHLFLLHLKPFASFFLAATVIGLPLVFYLAQKWLSNFAYHISLTPVYFILPVVGVSLVILLAAGFHATRCATINPVDILKEE